MAVLGTKLSVSLATKPATNLANSEEPTWSPSNIGSIHSWWRADSGTDAASVGTWTDRVSGRTLTQSTSGAKPSLQSSVSELNGQPALRFDGSNDYLVSSDAASTWKFLHDGSGCHVFVVARSLRAKPDASGGRIPFLATAANYSDTGVTICEVPNSPSSAWFQIFSSGSTVVSSYIPNVFTNSTPRWFESMYIEGRPSNEYKVRASGGFAQLTGNSSIAPSSANSAATLHVGTRGDTTVFQNADIAEILIFNAEVTGSDYTNLISYLDSRYGFDSVKGVTSISTSNRAQTADGVAVGDAAGFWVAALVTIPSQAVASATRRIVSNRVGSTGWTIRTTGTNTAVDFAVLHHLGASFSPSYTVTVDDVGKVILLVAVLDSSNVLRLYNKRIEVGSGSAMGGIYQPASGAGNYTAIGHQGGAEPFDGGGIIHGVAYGTGSPTLAQVQAYYDAVKAADGLVSLTGVTTSNLWIPTAGTGSIPDSVGGQNATITGTLSYAAGYSSGWSW